jgi:hypothetical protein
MYREKNVLKNKKERAGKPAKVDKMTNKIKKGIDSIEGDYVIDGMDISILSHTNYISVEVNSSIVLAQNYACFKRGTTSLYYYDAEDIYRFAFAATRKTAFFRVYKNEEEIFLLVKTKKEEEVND